MRNALLFLVLTLSACEKRPELVRVREAAAPLWIAGVDVLDVVTGSVARGRDVRVEGELIAEIVPAGAAPQGAIDGRGATLIPGLIDAHVHINTSSDPPWTKPMPDAKLNLQRFLYTGVTTVFETGGMAPEAFELRDDVAAGEILGPRIFTTGPVFTAPEGHPIPMLKNGLPDWLEWYVVPRLVREITTPDEARAAVDELATARPDAVKIMLDRIPSQAPLLARELARAVVDRAKDKGLRAVAHIGTTTAAIDAAEAGVSAWVHGVYKERIPEALIPKLAAYGIPMVPTMIVFESYGVVGHGPRERTALEQETVPVATLDARDRPPAEVDLPEGGREFLDELYKAREIGLDNVRRLHAAGVVMLAGSDSQSFVYHGPGLHRELALLARALPPIDVVRAATLHPARLLTAKQDPPFGVVAPGKIADLVLVEGDPLADIGAISKIRGVIVRGRALERTPVGSAR